VDRIQLGGSKSKLRRKNRLHLPHKSLKSVHIATATKRNRTSNGADYNEF